MVKVEMMEMTACFSDPQSLLSSALELNSLEQCRFALGQNASPDLIDKSSRLSIFHKACETPGASKFVQLCIEAGCDVNQKNGYLNKHPINFAADSHDPENLKVLLKSNADVNALFEGNLTALHQLTRNVNVDNIDRIFDCIKVLVEYDANVNIPDIRNQVAITVLADNDNVPGIENIINYLLEYCEVDLDTYADGEARELLMENFPNVKLPAPNTRKHIDIHGLKALLRDHKQRPFNDNFEEFMKTRENSDNTKNILLENTGDGTLMQIAVKEGLTRAVKGIIKFGDKQMLTANSSNILYTPIALACLWGHPDILKLLLDHVPDSLESEHHEPLLSIVIRKMQTDENCVFSKCFDILIDHPKIDINNLDEQQGNSALHIAVRYKNDRAVKMLLKRGAYIGGKNRYKELPITDIKPSLLEEHFDSCIQTNDLRPGDENFEIIFNYTSLVPAVLRSQEKDVKDMKFAEEMMPIEYMITDPELRKFINHPLISSFLWLKWHRLSFVFYMNFTIYSLFCLAMIAYLVFCYGHDVSPHLANLLFTVSFIGLCYIIIREGIQFLMSPRTYFTYTDNYLEIILIIIMTLVLFVSDSFADQHRRILAAVAILLIASEFSLLVGSLPFMSVSTHMVMLKSVSITFIRSLFLYSIIIVSFALCFYTLLRPSEAALNSNADGETDGDFNNFEDPGTSIVKTIVMFTGEFEAADIKFGENKTTYVIFVLFVFFISIVLLNLLNGLAVSDTQAIKSEAELTGRIYRAQLLSRYERMIIQHPGTGISSKLRSIILGSCSGHLINIFQKYLPLFKIAICPNDNNRIFVHRLDPDVQMVCHTKPPYDYQAIEHPPKEKSTPLPPILPLCCCLCSSRCAQLDGKIVRCAQSVIEKNRNKDEIIVQDNASLAKRIQSLEETIQVFGNILATFNHKNSQPK